MQVESYHIPVMLSEVEEYLLTNTSGLYADCTIGGAGHSFYLLNKYPKLKIIGIDCDEAALAQAKIKTASFAGRIEFVRGNFGQLKELINKIGVLKLDGVLLDLGVSSRQFDDKSRGFSFMQGPLDMRMDNRSKLTAKDIVNLYSCEQLAEVFYRFGEERESRKIARYIVQKRLQAPIETANELALIVQKAKKSFGSLNPATKVFQALRIVVNGELDSLELVLKDLPDLLKSGSRAVVISYHSLEDRIVKNNFRQEKSNGIYEVLTKKIVVPKEAEITSNPRSRSAKLRAAKRLN